MGASPWPWDAIKKRVADMMSSGYGGQTPPVAVSPMAPPSRTDSDPLFPAWLCKVGLPSGLITLHCP